ncbi:MAG: PilZ protein [Sphingomonas bacterium]|uniref:PilZ domain-containing protein n=1 Tax=Sphingomonas bacterium TaxID=1895847 RepID=UPI00262DAE0C|nr:PilZ domain-containing protein [Sphingomonas bacterium]MDB5705983.1 PilZ protein [Sphingomonas bacterium]
MKTSAATSPMLSDPPDRRDRVRFALKLAVSVRLPGQRRSPARLVDLSAGGCRILAPMRLAAGMSLWLKMAGLDPLYCHVVWAHDRFAGVRFAVPLADDEVERLIADHRDVTERDTAELRLLSQRCAELARGAGASEGAALDALARDCEATVAEFDEGANRKRAAEIEARTQAILGRLSVADRPAE